MARRESELNGSVEIRDRIGAWKEAEKNGSSRGVKDEFCPEGS